MLAGTVGMLAGTVGMLAWTVGMLSRTTGILWVGKLGHCLRQLGCSGWESLDAGWDS